MSVSNLSSQTPVFQHACPFATEPTAEGQVTSKSIKRRQQELNDTGCLLSVVRRQAVLNAIEGNSTVAGLCQTAGNPARSGIWNADGSLNAERLRELKNRCVDLEGTPILTRAIFQRFVDERRAVAYKGCLPYSLAFGNLTYVGCLPIPYTKVTDGSIDAFFHAYARFEHNQKKAVSWNTVCTFYDPDNSAKLRED